MAMHVNCRCVLIVTDELSARLDEIKGALLEVREPYASHETQEWWLDWLNEVQEWLDWRAFLKDVEATTN